MDIAEARKIANLYYVTGGALMDFAHGGPMTPQASDEMYAYLIEAHELGHDIQDLALLIVHFSVAPDWVGECGVM